MAGLKSTACFAVTCFAIAAMSALVTGCSRTDNEPGPGGVTVSEAKALDDAAAMLESRDAAPATETGAADNEKTGQEHHAGR